MKDLALLKEVAPYLTQPLALVGFTLLTFFGAQRALLKVARIPRLTPRAGATVVGRVMRYGFVIALLVILLGFALARYQAGREHDPTQATSILKQEAIVREGGTAFNAGRDFNLGTSASPSPVDNGASSVADAPAAQSVIQDAKAEGGGIAINAAHDANVHK
jgi:hypothetical protein